MQTMDPSTSSVFRKPSFFGRSKTSRARPQVPSSIQLPPSAPTAPADLPARPATAAVLVRTPPADADAYADADAGVAPPVASQYDPPRTPQKRFSRHSISSTVDGLQLRRSRSTSLRSAASSHHKRHPSASTMHSVSLSPDKGIPPAAPLAASRPTLSISTFARNKAKSSDNVKPDGGGLQHYDKTPLSALDKPKSSFGMAVPIPLRHPHPPSQKDMQQAQRQGSIAGASLAPAAPIPVPNGANPHIIFQHIQELASKRISTLDYLRKAHEGRIYWFNTLLFSKNDLTRLPSFTPRAQSRRATQYLLLGFSLPTILDMHANSPGDYLRALNALLLEFEQYQSMHPTDGSAPSLSRARIPQMFKRANLGGKGRRSSSATGDFPLLTPQTSYGSESSSGAGGGGGGLAGMVDPPTSFPSANDDLNPGESYTYLQTPSLPFDPDFFSTFASLCDVLIDCYSKMLSMLSTPESVAQAGQGVPSTVGDLFSKADARVRKIILAGVVREFEESCRAGVRGEVGGVGKVVLGGLM